MRAYHLQIYRTLQIVIRKEKLNDVAVRFCRKWNDVSIFWRDWKYDCFPKKMLRSENDLPHKTTTFINWEYFILNDRDLISEWNCSESVGKKIRVFCFDSIYLGPLCEAIIRSLQKMNGAFITLICPSIHSLILLCVLQREQCIHPLVFVGLTEVRKLMGTPPHRVVVCFPSEIRQMDGAAKARYNGKYCLQ